MDGDKTLSTIVVADGKEGPLTRAAGTGKYEGMETTRTVEQLGPFKPIKDGTSHGCNRQTGTYKMK